MERCDAGLSFWIVGSGAHENANAPHPLGRRLRPCRERPRGRATEQRDELAASHCRMPPVLRTKRIAHLDTAGDCRAAAFQSSLFRFSVACPLPPGTDKVDSAEGTATLEAMSSHHNFRPGQQNKLVSEPPIAAPDEHAQLVEADQQF